MLETLLILSEILRNLAVASFLTSLTLILFSVLIGR